DLETLTKKLQELTVKDEFSQILTGNGAAGLNASTSTDLTSYVVALPANRLELWCLLESARLRDPVLREFYSERDVVMEERRMRVDNQPQGKMYEQLLLSAFQAHPYRVPTVGFMSDLEHVTRPQAVAPSPDGPVFAVIDSLLTSGRTSRLFRRLVLETRVASDVYSMQVPGDRYPNLFGIGATPRAPHTASEVEAGILQELRRLG